MFGRRMAFGLTVAVFFALAPRSEAGLFVNSESLGYTGSWTRYGNLADAQNGVNPLGTGTVPQRDLSIYLTNGAPDIWPNSTYILTNWYSGSPNPSNTNYGFLQIGNDPASYPSQSPLSVTANGYWLDGSLTSYRLDVSGSGATYADAFARFGEIAGGAGSTTTGTFHNFALSVTFGGLSGAYNPISGRYESTGLPTSVTGSFKAIFENTGTDPSRHGFYAIDLSINNTSWAVQNGHIDPAAQSFSSTNVVAPEPASLLIFGSCLVGGAFWFRRRRHAADFGRVA